MRIGLSKTHEDELQFPEHLVQKAETWLLRKMKTIWTFSKDEATISYQKAINDLSMDKSPGYPYFYDCDDKKTALVKYGDIVKDRVTRMLLGEDVPCYFALTEKSELRVAEKVNEGKTRVFMASDLHHLVTSMILFEKQNEILIDKRGQTPSTIGMQIPGPEFPRVLLGLGDKLNDGDVSGCDLRFKLRLARSIRNIRSWFHHDHYRQAIKNLYDYVYAGACVGLGGIFRIFGNKSGWFNTGHDNTLMTWLCLIIACYKFFPDRDPEEVIAALINGDDLAVCQKLGSFREFCIWLKQYNFVIEAEDWTPREPREIVYLSHHIEERYVSGFGHFVLAAGNLSKILSSLQYIKKSQTLSFEESCVAHLVGLRICLFPWAVEFKECDKLLSNFLSSIVLTEFIRNCLKARFSERDLAILHTRVEGFYFLPILPVQVAAIIKDVLDL